MSKMLTVPNGLTFIRALGIPVFLYLALVPHADIWAVVVLSIGGATDYFDGKIARAWNQTSRFGEIADPTIDRMYILAVLIALYIRDAIPLWLVVVIVGRDLFLALVTIDLKRRKESLLTVTFAGKAATFNLLYAFPFLLLALQRSLFGTICFIIGWSFALWGIGLYLATGWTYARTGLKRAQPRVKDF